MHSLRYASIAFITGAAIMVGEIAAARAISPHFGTSIVVWTNVIGVVLIALSLGYWWGGRLAERVPNDRVLGFLLAAAGALLIIPAFATRWFAESILADAMRFPNGFLVVLSGSLLAITVLFALPIALLGAVSPMLVKLACAGRADVGAIAGRLSAVATIGSLVGTFLPTLVLLPTIGTRRTILAAAAVLLMLGAWMTLRGRHRTVVTATLALAAIAAMGAREPLLPWMFGGMTIAQRDSRYQLIRVVDRPGDDGERTRVLVFNEGFGVQSRAVFDPRDAAGYAPLAAAMPALVASAEPRVLVLGNAAGSLALLMEAFAAPAQPRITGVEIDPYVTAMAAAAFPPPRQPYRIVHADSRVFLRRDPKQYDAIVADAYTNQLTIPAHLATREFFALVRERLADDGIAVVNVNAPSSDSRLLRAIARTIAVAFPYTVTGKAGETWNYLIVASDTPIADRLERLRALAVPDRAAAEITRFLETARAVPRDGGEVLTDDRAPIELMTDRELFDALRDARVQ